MKILKFFAVVLALSLPIMTVPYFFASAIELHRKIDEETVITVFRSDLGETVEMTLFDYLTGVVAAEMPALYDNEALKAQAAACFTYFVRREGSASAEHGGASVCTSSSHCSAFIDEERQRERWGDDYQTYRQKIEEAVRSVFGKVITYKGKPIDALYFARSSGKTENASDVWGNSYAYLVSVNSEVDMSGSGFETEKSFSHSEFAKKIKEKYPNASGDASIEILSRFESGGVSNAAVMGVTLTGKELRGIFSLNSSNFTVTVTDTDVIFNVKGKGHGVGMSQYGANMMAKLGYGWEDIIKHYYTGVEISDFNKGIKL